MKLRKGLLVFCLALLLSGHTALAAKVIEVPYTDDLMIVDGVLDEWAWSEATTLRICADPVANGCDNDPDGVKGDPAEHEYYEVSFVHDGFMLYMAVTAYVDYVTAADPSTVFSTGIPEFLIKLREEDRGVPYRLTWVDPAEGAGPSATDSSMWFWAPNTGEWAYDLMDGTVPNSGQPGTGYVLETSISLFEIGYLNEVDPIPFSLVLFNYDGPVGGKWDAPEARYSRYELGEFQTLAETANPRFTHELHLLW